MSIRIYSMKHQQKNKSMTRWITSEDARMIDSRIVRTRFWLVIGFVSALSAYSFHTLLWEHAFYPLIAFSFFAYTRVIFLLTKHTDIIKRVFSGAWSVPVLVIHLTTVNALYDEILGDPTKIQSNEYISVILMVGIVIYKRYKEKIISYYKKLKSKWIQL